ncbi:MAG TPA: uroporphyrinogen decarboxylase family protein [Patescibacteria group bacterium]|nr:uroporphyrinogen decarboxylase family protein [Patescibacteria group bacterium]
MRHRDRVRAALAREVPDRCPMQVSFTPEFAERLRRDLVARGLLADADFALNSDGVRAGQHNPHGGGNTYELERALDEDILLTSVGWANGYYAAGDEYLDEWGVRWRSQPYETRFGTGRYTEMVGHPLADDAALASYVPPDPDRDSLYVDAEHVIRTYGDEYFIVGATVTTIWETAWALRGYTQLLIDMVTDEDLADAIFEIPFRYHMAAAERLAAMGVDMLWTGDDIGTQRGMLFSPATWRRFLKPRMAELIARVKAANPALKVAYHTDGDVRQVLPELAEIGIDVLNPVQPACMDPAWIKREYGDRLLFWGSIDEQRTLPFGTPQDVRDEIRLRLDTIGRGGGLILGPTHHVQLDTPLENFWAMVEAIRDSPCR